MNGWIIFGFIVFAFFLWIWISDHRDKMKAKAVEDTEKEYKFGKIMGDVKNILRKKKYFSNLGFIEDDNNIYVSDKTIGHCPKCQSGYLVVAKTFTGMDEVYNRYPTYYKFLKCSNCEYTENYFNLRSRRSATKFSTSQQFKNDFIDAYAKI